VLHEAAHASIVGKLAGLEASGGQRLSGREVATGVPGR
jgi:hypothetical protein